MYPTKLCDSILANIANMRTTSQDGGRKKLPDKPPHTFAMQAGSGNLSKYDQVLHRLQELRSIATKFGFADLFNTLVDPWIVDSPLYKSGIDSYVCSSKLYEQEASGTSSDVGPSRELTITLDRINTTLANLAFHISRAAAVPSTIEPVPSQGHHSGVGSDDGEEVEAADFMWRSEAAPSAGAREPGDEAILVGPNVMQHTLAAAR